MSFAVDKDPQADLDYQVDWSKWLGADTIVESTWSVPAGSGLVTHDAAVDGAAKKATVWVRGGTAVAGSLVVHRLTNHIKTAAGREDDRSILLTIVNR